MNTIICTLFEGNYHYGVAALTNSLHSQGFRGEIFAGYRGQLPNWANNARDTDYYKFEGIKTLSLSDGILLSLLEIKPDAEALFYFDPDIIVTVPWSVFEEWITCGVALSEDVNSPLSENHPIRIAWRKYFSTFNQLLTFKNPIYVNGGFVGISLKDKDFLLTWKKLQEAMGIAIGGLNRSAIVGGSPLPLKDAVGPFVPFGKTDQDALNAAIETWAGVFSFLGKEGMGFGPGSGAPLMPHSLGQPKPWTRKYLKSSMQGRTPGLCDKAFWSNVEVPIKLYSTAYTKLKKTSILSSSFIGRFYKK
jgi:hypothetical protein